MRFSCGDHLIKTGAGTQRGQSTAPKTKTTTKTQRSLAAATEEDHSGSKDTEKDIPDTDFTD
jgi:hypothetical protein